jgi:glutathione S-transferase
VSAPLVLVSHALCPYVQRAAIVLAEKGASFERRWIDLAAKPAWFTAISPLGKTPVLLVGETALFESAPICEYLDETLGPRLLADDALARARERAWIAFASALLDDIAAFYNAPDDAALAVRHARLEQRFRAVDAALGEGPWFAGGRFGLVDAAFAPVFRYVDAFDVLPGPGFVAAGSKVAAWRRALAARPSVSDAVRPDYPRRLRDFLGARKSALSRALAGVDAVGAMAA